MNETLKLLLSYLSKIHKKTEAEISELIFDGDINEGKVKADALQSLVTLEETRTKSLKGAPATAKALKDAEAAERKKVLEELKGQFEQTFPDFKSDNEIGLDFLTELSEALTKPANPNAAAEITDDAWQKSKQYRDLKSQHGLDIKKLEKEWKDKWEGREREIKKKESFNSVRGKALKMFRDMKPILPEDTAIAERQTERLLLNELYSGYEYVIEGTGDDEKITVLKDGKPLEDSLGHLVDFSTHLKQIASQNFTFAVADPKNAGGNPNGNGHQGAGDPDKKGKSKKFLSYSLNKPASDQEWLKQNQAIEEDKELSPAERTDLQLKLGKLHTEAAVTK